MRGYSSDESRICLCIYWIYLEKVEWHRSTIEKLNWVCRPLVIDTAVKFKCSNIVCIYRYPQQKTLQKRRKPGVIKHYWWLIKLPCWFKAGLFCLKFWEFPAYEVKKKTFLCQVRLNPPEVKLNIRKLEFWNFMSFFLVFSCSIQSEVIK